MKPESVMVTCEDGYALRVNAFVPANPAPHAVLISPANGVPARFYAKFAGWLAEQGYTTITWDWRGLGDSAPASLHGFEATMLDWAMLDQSTVHAWTHARFGMPFIGIGHSFGGQVFGLARNTDFFSKLILFGSGNAYWRLWPAPGRYLFRAAISALLALTSRIGYLPGKRLGLGADLPKGVAEQWLNWCLQPDYHGLWDGHARMTVPVVSYAFSDDRYAPIASRQDLLQRYGGDKTLLTPTPQEHGVARVGHLNFFRSRFADTLWPAFLPVLKS